MCEIFINYCFQHYGFQKIKALVYPDNSRVKTLLKNAGFVKEALLKSETLRKGQLQDIELYSVFNNKATKIINKGGKNEDRSRRFNTETF